MPFGDPGQQGFVHQPAQRIVLPKLAIVGAKPTEQGGLQRQKRVIPEQQIRRHGEDLAMRIQKGAELSVSLHGLLIDRGAQHRTEGGLQVSATARGDGYVQRKRSQEGENGGKNKRHDRDFGAGEQLFPAGSLKFSPGEKNRKESTQK